MADDIFTVQRKPLSWQEMTRQAMAEEARKQTPMGWEVPVDQLYAPSSDVPVSGGFAPGGAEYDPTPEMIASMVPWGAMTKGAIAELKALGELGAIGRDISLKTPERAKELVNINLPKGMHRIGGESIPARELQLPNIRPELKSAKVLKQRPEAKELLGTSIGQGESVREGDIANAIEAAIRAIRYERRLPKPKLPK